MNRPTPPGGSSSRRGSRNHHTSIGTPNDRGRSPAAARTAEPRPSQATVSRSAQLVLGRRCSRSTYRTPATRCPSCSSSATSALRRSVNVGSSSAASASRSSKSHCGTSAMCWCAPGSRRRSATWEAAVVELHLHAVQQPVRDACEALAEAELVEQGQGGRVHGVAAEVAQEVGVLLQHRDLDPGPGHEQPEDHPGRAAPDDEAGRALVIRHALKLALRRRRGNPPAACGRRSPLELTAAGRRGIGGRWGMV